MKTTRTLLILILIVSFICLFSCKNNYRSNSDNSVSSDKDSAKVDTLWNAKVQDTFFDTKFGASREEVIKNFAKHGLTLDKSVSSDTRLTFYSNKSKYYTFGDMGWALLNVYLTDRKFSSISFFTPMKDKAQAISSYKSIVDELSKKYKLTSVEYTDTTTYEIKRAYSKSGIVAWIRCYRYESVEQEIYYTAELGYIDTNMIKYVSDEL